MYFFGRGVDRDYKQAMTWYGKASDLNFADAQFRLGFMYEKGLGVDQSNQNAIDQYAKAVRNGSVEAQRALDRLATVKQFLDYICLSMILSENRFPLFGICLARRRESRLVVCRASWSARRHRILLIAMGLRRTGRYLPSAGAAVVRRLHLGGPFLGLADRGGVIVRLLALRFEPEPDR